MGFTINVGIWIPQILMCQNLNFKDKKIIYDSNEETPERRPSKLAKIHPTAKNIVTGKTLPYVGLFGPQT